MAGPEAELKSRLGRVRRRWKLTAAVRGLLLVATEALGISLLVLLADLIYSFSGKVLLGLWCVGGAVLAVLFTRHVLYPLFRRISDEQIALLVEERAEQAEGAVISAVEFRRQRRGGLYSFLVGFLVDDAVHRIDRTPLRVVSNLRRLRKHVLVATVLLLVFVGTTVSVQQFRTPEGRTFNPLARIQQDTDRARRQLELRRKMAPKPPEKLTFEVSPGNVDVLRGGAIPVVVRLSRATAVPPELLCRSKKGKWETLPMFEIPALRSYSRQLSDIAEDMEYKIAAGSQESGIFTAKVYDPLRIKSIELTYDYPKYLELPQEVVPDAKGDIMVPAGTKVGLRVLANNQIKSGKVVFEEKIQDKQSVPLEAGAKAADGAKVSFPVPEGTNTSYMLTVADVYGSTVTTEEFYYVKAVPDEPPTVEMVSPRVDMSIHPLCEVTFKAKITDDFGVKEGLVKAKLYKGEKVTPLTYKMKTTDDADKTENVKDGEAEYVLELDSAKPSMQTGDMIFYHFEVSDRKGQVARTDVFYIKMWPLEVAATWPDSVAPPDLPHETFNDPMDLMLFLAAAWHLEQQRGEIPAAEFNAKSEKIAQRMEVGDPPDFSTFWGHGGAPEGGGPNRGQILTTATKHIETAHGLLKYKKGSDGLHLPGQAADFMRIALAMVETLDRDKRVLALELNPEPLHTGQPSSGHADDPVMEQIAFRPPTTMTDALTAFQQPDNPPRLLPPDYRRALRVKERKAFRVKQLRIAGEIYATEEQIVEMAREQLGHIQLREAIDDNTPNDPAQSGGAGGEEIRVDKRAIPYKEMVTADERRGSVAQADKQTLSEPKVDRVKSPLKYDKLRGNERRGGSNPYMSQAPGSGGGEDDPEDQDRPRQMDEEALRRMRQRIMARRPPSGGGGGGGEESQTGMQQPGEMGQQQGGGQASLQQMSAWQQALGQAAGELARDVARHMEPGDSMSRGAVGELRQAAGQMKMASRSFERGDVRAGIQHARRAQGLLRTAMHRLNVSQYDNLEQAVAAAQDGAAALVANQYRVNRSTEQVARRIGEMTGQPGQAQPGTRQPGQAQPGTGQPGQAQPGTGQPGQAQPGTGQPGQAQPGTGQPGQAQPGAGKPGEVQAPSRQAVEKAVALDPRIGPQLKGLAAQQGKLAQDLGAFTGYVNDLKKWADEAAKDRVAGSLTDVSGNLRREGTAQKMVDAAVGLAARDLPSARQAQKDVEAALWRMEAGVREAGEILAGSRTGVLRRAAREAKDIGTQVASLAGQGQPGQGQPGQGQPGQGQPGQGQPGQGQPGQGQPGQGQPGQAQPGQGQPGQGQPGKPQTGEAQPGTELAQRLTDQQGELSGEPGDDAGSPSSAGGGAGSNRDIGQLWVRSRRLAGTLRSLEDEELEQTIRFIQRKAATIQDFKKMFERARKAEAMKFSSVVLGVGENMEAKLQEELSAKRLHAEQREECPPKYRDYVDAYYEALSKAATRNDR